MSYGAVGLFHEVAIQYVSRILKGSKPALRDATGRQQSGVHRTCC
jgi:hypothetical protein